MSPTLLEPTSTITSGEKVRAEKINAQLEKVAQEKRELDERIAARAGEWARLCGAAHSAQASVRQVKGTVEGVRADAERHRSFVRGTIRPNPGEAVRISGIVALLEASIPVLESMIAEIEVEAANAFAAARAFAQAENISVELWPAELRTE